MPRPMEEISKRYAAASKEFKEAERELKAASNKQTKEMLPLVGHKIADAVFYEDGEGSYQMTLDNNTVVTFSAQGDDATYATINIEREP